MVEAFRLFVNGKVEDVKAQIKNVVDLLFTVSLGEIKSPLLSKIQKKSGVKTLFYLSYDETKKLSCLASSDETLIGKRFDYFPFIGTQKEDTVFFASPLSHLILACQSVRASEERGRLFLEFGIDLKKKPRFFNTTIFLKGPEPLFSSNPAFLRDKLGEEISLSQIREGELYEYTFLKENGFAIVERIQPGLSLLFTFDESHIRSLHWSSYLVKMGWLSLELAIVSFFVGWIIFMMSRPLKELFSVMNRVGEGEHAARYQKQKFGFEINSLGLFFNQMLEALSEHQKEIELHKLERQRLLQEFKIGHKIQKNILSEPMKIEGLDIAPGYLPAKEVGGDFYDLFPLNDEKILITIADTAGKGISACLYSLSVRSMLRSFALSCTSLGELISKANDLFILDAKESGMFVTAWIGIYDLKTKKLSYASMGHPFAVLKRKNEFLELGTANMAMGIEKQSNIEIKEVLLMNGDLLVLYTDGVIEAENQAGQLFGKEGVKKSLKGRFASAKATVFSLLQEIKLFSKSMPQTDDITLLVFKIL